MHSLSWLLWWRIPCLRKAVIVQFEDGAALRGVLWAAKGPWLIVRSAIGLEANAQPLQIDGEVVVHRTKVKFVQVLPE